ncbi:NAD(P)H-binding protein [Collimonas sp. NPDC087041]|uniref:NAD(P)H-binding protein n=1 Tax=Collimonas sp. NPDC087041 TaxID=3363960 RepID=UPI0038157E3A
MTRVLILGANGQVARHTTARFLANSNAKLTLYLRRASRLKNPDPKRVTVVEGDVLDMSALISAMRDQDVVFASLAGDLNNQAQSIVAAMDKAGLKRLIFVSSMGIYGEVPGEKYRSILDPYRDAAAVIELSNLDYTVLRPGWFTQNPKIDYQITQKGEPFLGHDISLNSLSDLIVKLSLDSKLYVGCSIGVSQ